MFNKGKIYNLFLSVFIIVLIGLNVFVFKDIIKKNVFYNEEYKIISDLTNKYTDILLNIKINPWYEQKKIDYVILSEPQYDFFINNKKHILEYNIKNNEIVIKNFELKQMCSKTYTQTIKSDKDKDLIFKDVVSFVCEGNDAKVIINNFNGKIIELLTFNNDVIEL